MVAEVARPSGELPLDVARWLVGDEGLAAVADATARLDDGVEPADLPVRLARDTRMDVARRAAVTAAATARVRARGRWADADRLVFTRTALEQASDPAVSAWRARRFAEAPAVEDRAAGVGGDALALAATGVPVTASDTDASRLVLLAHNARVRDVAIDTVVADALVTPPPRHGPVHVDPARRVGERRVRRLADHRPSVPALLAHLEATRAGAGVAVVTSPAVDLGDPDLPLDAELELVQLGRDLVEAVLWTGDLRTPGAEATATLLTPDGQLRATRARGARGARLPVGSPGEVVVDVAPAAVRARLHDELGAEIGARRVATRRALLTADEAPPTSPWWQVRPIVAVLPARASAVRRWLEAAPTRPVELVRHGLDVDLRRFATALGRPPTGPDGWRVELVRTDDGALALVTETPSGPAPTARPGSDDGAVPPRT